jgi:peroxiredoxin
MTTTIMRFPDFDLPAADGGRLTNADLAGRPWFAYLARHPGCFVCQAKLAEALTHRDELRAVGGDIVLFFNADLAYTRMWVAKSVEEGHLPADLQVAVDSDAELYEAIGTVRRGLVGSLVGGLRQTLGSLWRSRAHIGKWRLTSNDMLRMGADVAVRADGTIALRHVCADPEDRADPHHVVAALREQAA